MTISPVPRRRLEWTLIAALCGAGCSSPGEPVPFADDPEQPEGRRVVGLVGAFQTKCALVDTGLLHCWGENRFGEFGNGTGTPSATPVLGGGGMAFERVFGSQGNPRICGIDAEGDAFCWGYNANGELGDGTTEDRLLPATVAGGLRFRMLATSYHSCGIATTGRAYCWGSDLGGQLGDGGQPGEKLTPTAVASNELYETLANGMQFTCALRIGGLADCWGWGVGLGSGEADRSVDVPTPVDGGRRYMAIAAASEWACALDLAGAAYCWGNAGPLWPDDIRPAPEPVATSLRFRSIVATSIYGACALTEEGEAYCWGGLEAPIAVPGRRRYAGLMAVNGDYCGYTPGGSAYCWKWRGATANRVSTYVLSDPESIPAFPP